MERILNDSQLRVKLEAEKLIAQGWKVKAIIPYTREYIPNSPSWGDGNGRALEDRAWIIMEQAMRLPG